MTSFLLNVKGSFLLSLPPSLEDAVPGSMEGVELEKQSLLPRGRQGGADSPTLTGENLTLGLARVRDLWGWRSAVAQGGAQNS